MTTRCRIGQTSDKTVFLTDQQEQKNKTTYRSSLLVHFLINTTVSLVVVSQTYRIQLNRIMDNDEFHQYLTLAGGSFYSHIEEKYGKNVEKILRYHDVDSYLILGKTNKHELLDVLEKIDDSNSSIELNELKKEVCNTFNGKISLKIGTKNKLDTLLKSAHDTVKLNKSQMMNQTKLNQLDEHRSASLSNDGNTSDSEISLTKHTTLVNESVSKLLTTIKYNIHGTINANISANDFEVIVKDLNDQSEPICIIQCVCGDRIKLYLRNNRFQLSNLQKHLKIVNKKSSSFTNDIDQAIDDQEYSNQINIDSGNSRSENNRSITQHTPNNSMGVDSDNIDKSTTTKS